MPKSAPINVRLDRDLDERVTALAKRVHRPKSAVIASLIDEAERERRYPGLRFRGPDHARRPYVLACGWDVWEIIWALKGHDDSPERLAREADLPLGCVNLAQAYYAEFPAEIDDALLQPKRSPAELRRDYPLAEFTTIEG
jgi:hypothetical protein